MHNLFGNLLVAQYYQMGRPSFHSLVIERVREFTGIRRVGRALDIGCGTGKSTQALTSIADKVDAIDAAPEMLHFAPSLPGVCYTLGVAECLPYPDATFEFATVGVAHHWFNRDPFLVEAARVLKPSAWLVVYNHGYTGKVTGLPAFYRWVKEEYEDRFPAPLRDTRPFTNDTAHFGLEVIADEYFEHDLEMSRDQLVAFLATQSNVVAATGDSEVLFRGAMAWIQEGISLFVTERPVTVAFSAKIWYLRRTAQTSANPLISQPLVSGGAQECTGTRTHTRKNHE